MNLVKYQCVVQSSGRMRVDYTTYAAYDGAQAEVLGLYGFGANLKAKVRLKSGMRTGEITLPTKALKPVPKPTG